MTYMDANAAFAGDIQELSFDEIVSVGGGSVDWDKVGRFAGRAFGLGSRVGLWGVAGGVLALAVYVAVDAVD